MGRAVRSYTVTNGKLTHPSDKVARAEHEADKRMNGRLDEALAALGKRGALAANGTNGTHPPNSTANGHLNGHANGTANGHAAAPLNTVATVAVPAVPATPAPAPGDGRDTSGRFAEGNRAAAGNPFHRAVAARRRALLDAVSAEDVAQIGRTLYAQALAGDVAAAKVLLAYLIGKPASAADPDRLDLDELALMTESPDMNKMLAGMMNGLPPQLAMVLGAAAMEMCQRRVLDGLDAKAAAEGAR